MTIQMVGVALYAILLLAVVGYMMCIRRGMCMFHDWRYYTLQDTKRPGVTHQIKRCSRCPTTRTVTNKEAL